MPCTHSDLDLAIGPTAIAEHPCPDNLDSKAIHLLHQPLEKLFPFTPMKGWTMSKVVSHVLTRLQELRIKDLLQRCSEIFIRQFQRNTASEYCLFKLESIH